MKISRFLAGGTTGFSLDQRKSMALAVIGVCLSLAGCHTGAPDHSKSGLLAIELIPADRGYYRDVRVERMEGELVVHGYVKRFIEPGHVRVQLLSIDGIVVAEDRVRVSRPLRSSRVRHAAFATRMTESSEPVSLRITFERSDGETD